MITLVKPKRSKSRTSRTSDPISHLHVVVDDALRTRLEAHARKLEGRSRKDTDDKRPNLSAAVRDLLRRSLGLPTVTV